MLRTHPPLPSRVQLISGVVVIVALCQHPTTAAPPDVPHDLAHLLADPTALERPMELPAADGKTSDVFRPNEGGWTFNLHSYIARFDEAFWAVWSSGRRDEDSAGQVVRYATSADGHKWSDSRILTRPHPTPAGPGICIARGVFVHGGRLTALVAFFDKTIPGKEWVNLRLVRFVWDGQAWRNEGVWLDDCMNNYPPRPINGRLFMTCRNSVRKMHTALADSLEGDRWTVSALPGQPPADRMSEPSWYVDPEGLVHLIFRDQRRSGFLHRSTSKDNGATWSPPVRTNYPDATSKNFTGRLSDGTYYLINNPAQRRDPLAVSFSRDGWTFDRPVALRKGAPALRFPGRAKPNRTFQYPHAIEHAGSLWMIYSTNKEDIQITEYPLGRAVPPSGNSR